MAKLIGRNWAESTGRPDRTAGRTRTDGSRCFRRRQPSSSETGRHHHQSLIIISEGLQSIRMAVSLLLNDTGQGLVLDISWANGQELIISLKSSTGGFKKTSQCSN